MTTLATRVPSTQALGTHTWEDFVALDEDDRRELIDGDLVETEMPGEIHEHIVAMLLSFLGSWVVQNNAGRIYASGYKVKVSRHRGVMPDVQFYRRGNSARITPNGVEAGRPDLAIEVLSPTRRGYDRVTKLRYYASIGVPEYWMIDPEEQTLEQLLLHDGKYVIAQVLQGEGPFCPDTFKGLTIPLGKLWEPWDASINGYVNSVELEEKK